MTTLIEVLDTAVKIGLGAGITAVVTYWHAKQKAKTESAKEYEKRHRTLLEQVANQIEVVNHVYLKNWALAVEFVRVRSQNEEWPQERWSKLDAVKEELFSAFSEFTSAESKLLLINETEAYKKTRELGDAIVKFARMNLKARTHLEEREMIEIRDNIRVIRDELYKTLSSSYQTNFT
ncbi:MAG: hypothetical protein RPV21_15910 [Candidatus Sedimenticola sp. (ex Thyasira tokunagai)]